MIWFHDTTDFYFAGPTAVTLGKFDGVHRGHKKLMKRVLEEGKNGVSSTVFAFNAHSHLLMTHLEQKKYLESLGIACLVDCPFVPEISCMSPEEFVRDILKGKLHAVYVAVGSDFRFGHKRAGDAAFLKSCEEKYDLKVDIIEKELYEGREISSTYIRETLEQGDMETVQSLLGRPYSVTGTVVHGRHMGTGFGMPTANLVTPAEKMLPPDGVYMTQTFVNGKMYRSVTNIGYKPTVGETFRGVETYLYLEEGESMDIYDCEITVHFLHYIRPEKRFASIDELKEQISRDIEWGRNYVIE